MTKIELLAAAVVNAKNTYEKIFDNARKKAEEDAKQARLSFIGDKLKEELAGIEETKEKAISSARREALHTVGSYADACMAEIRKKVQYGTFDKSTFAELEAIGRLPISGAEFNALCERFKGKSYWLDKQLQTIAEKNGLPYVSELSADDRLLIVSEIVNGFADYTKLYNGHGTTNMAHDDTARAFAAVSTSTLQNAVIRFNSQDGLSCISDDLAVNSALRSIVYADPLDGGMRLRNFMQNASDNAKNSLVLRLAGTDCKREVFNYAGIDPEEIRANYETYLNDYQTSRAALEDLKKSENKEEDMAKALENDGRGYIAGMIKSEARGNKDLRAAAIECGLIEEEGET